MNDELYFRYDSSLTGVRWKERIIELLAVPWEQETQVIINGEAWREVFERGAFDGLTVEGRKNPVRVNREHERGKTVGSVIFFDTKHQDGLLTRVRVPRTNLGDETLALAEEDMISASVGYYIKKKSDVKINPTAMTRRVTRAFLDHISMVEAPAYTGARVLAVHEGSQRPLAAEGEPLRTPNLDDVLSDPLFLWADSYSQQRDALTDDRERS